MTEFLHNMSMQVLSRENDNILVDFESVTNLVTSIIVLLKQQNKKPIQINDSSRVEVDKEISSNYQFTFDLLRLTLVCMWNSTQQEKFNFCFQEFFASIDKVFILAGRLDTRLSFYEV